MRPTPPAIGSSHGSPSSASAAAQARAAASRSSREAGLKIGKRPAGHAAHVRPLGLVAQHQRIGLRAVQQPERHAGERRVEQGALTLDQVPAAVVTIGRDPFGGARDEVGDHCVDRDAAAGDEDPGLPRRAEVRRDAACPELALERQGRVHLADRTVGADGQQPLAGATVALADAEMRRRLADVEQLQPGCRRGRADVGMARQPLMQPGCDIEAGVQRGDHIGDGARAHHAAGVGNADDQGLRALRHSLGEIQMRQPERNGAARAAMLADAQFGPPHRDAARGLGRKLVL
jgi:hypothetical protein